MYTLTSKEYQTHISHIALTTIADLKLEMEIVDFYVHLHKGYMYSFDLQTSFLIITCFSSLMFEV